MEEVSQFSFPTDIRSGEGARSALADFAGTREVHRPLLVTDSGLVTTSAFRLVVDEMEQVWSDASAQFTGASPNPTDLDVDGAWAAYAANGCDRIIGLGGGSALDAGTALRLKAAFPDVALSAMLWGPRTHAATHSYSWWRPPSNDRALMWKRSG